ncbi:MAG: acylphosphatase [Alphaproteobacteria bacterium]|nr:acylphosphatase [Alphaproteobacteria bacterium]MDP6517073.1 acylphosphatase [Alphaproteobacteria bacterium]
MPSLARDGRSAVSSSADDIAVRVVIRGRVQGVFYRGWCVETARGLGLHGGVRNRRDGTVEAVFAGPVLAVEAMIEQCRRGPPMARVAGLDREPCEQPSAPGFHQWPSR